MDSLWNSPSLEPRGQVLLALLDLKHPLPLRPLLRKYRPQSEQNRPQSDKVGYPASQSEYPTVPSRVNVPSLIDRDTFLANQRATLEKSGAELVCHRR